MKSSYRLITRTDTPTINPGNPIEIDVFISGYGKIEKNKFNLYHSSKNLVNSNNPGKIEWTIQVAKDKKTGKIIQPVSGNQYKGIHKLDSQGTYVTINEGYFLDDPKLEFEKNALPRIMSESTWDRLFPFSVVINTLTNAKPGNYGIDLIFTYSADNEISTDQKTVVIHVTSWKERHEKALWFIGISGAVILGILAKVL